MKLRREQAEIPEDWREISVQDDQNVEEFAFRSQKDSGSG